MRSSIFTFQAPSYFEKNSKRTSRSHAHSFFFFFFFFKERLGLKLTHKRITTKVVLPASKGKGAIQGEVKMCKEGESYDDKLLKSPKVRRYRVRNQRK